MSRLRSWTKYSVLSLAGAMLKLFFGEKPSLGRFVVGKLDTPPKFNIAPEKWWLEDYFPIGKVTFQGLC